MKVSCPYLLYVGGLLVLACELCTIELPCDEGALDCLPSSLAFSEAKIPNMFCANCFPLLHEVKNNVESQLKIPKEQRLLYFCTDNFEQFTFQSI